MKEKIIFPCLNVKMISRDQIIANNYNPNSVPRDKMELLKKSIIANGFCFPIVTIWDYEQEKYVIIDGFHRYTLCQPEWLDLLEVPIVVLKHDLAKRMIATMQFNKARGVHQIDMDADLIRGLIGQGLSDEEIADKLEITLDTVHRYKQLTGIAELFKNAQYSTSWEMVGQMNDMRYVVRTVSWDKKRAENVSKLKKILPNLEVYVDNKRDGYRSFLTVCSNINDTGAVVMEDDIELCVNFKTLVEDIIKSKGKDKVYNFFEKPKCYFKTSYVGGSNFSWTQCVYLPPKLPEKIIGHYENFRTNRPKRWKGMATDCLIAYTLVKEKMKYWRIRPCLVQHLPFDSVIGKRPNNRQSPYYIDLLKKKGISYDDLCPAQ